MASIRYVIDLYMVWETQKGTSYRDFLMMHYGLHGGQQLRSTNCPTILVSIGCGIDFYFVFKETQRRNEKSDRRIYFTTKFVTSNI